MDIRKSNVPIDLEGVYRELFSLRAEYNRKLDFEKGSRSAQKEDLIEIIRALNKVEDILRRHEQK
jgi:hypothetical protein